MEFRVSNGGRQSPREGDTGRGPRPRSTRAGSWSGPYLHRIFGFDRGFETYRLLGESVYDEEAFELGDTTRDPDWLDRKLAFDESFHGARSSPDLTKLVEQSLEELKGEPFFLFVHMFDPHADYDPPERYWRAFDPDYAGDLDATRYTSNPRITADMPPRDLEHVIARYDGEILWTDEHVGRMLDALERHGLADRTLVVVTSDHGEEFFEHGRAGHRMSLYDEQLLVPLLMRLPGRIPAGLRYGGQVRATDVAPTILELAGLPPEAQILGRSLVPYLDGRRASEDLPAVSTLVYPQSESMKSLRVPEWKLLEVQSAAHREPARSVYFDLAADPGEQRALSTRGQEHVLRALAQLESQADSWRRGLPGEGDTTITLPPALRDALEALGYEETDAASP